MLMNLIDGMILLEKSRFRTLTAKFSQKNNFEKWNSSSAYR